MIFRSNIKSKFMDSEVRTWLVDLLHRPSKKLRNCLKIKVRKILKDRQQWRRNCSTNTVKEENIQEPLDKKELALVLKSFYAEARKKDGMFYSIGSLKKLRFGLNRHFKVVREVKQGFRR